jgi:hypothetical protein
MVEWIDENGTRRFTNQEPPPGATIVKEGKEIPYDVEKDKARMEGDQQLLKESQARQMPPPAEIKETVGSEHNAEAVESAGGETWHQRQIEKKARLKQEMGNRPDTPKPAPHSQGAGKTSGSKSKKK